MGFSTNRKKMGKKWHKRRKENIFFLTVIVFREASFEALELVAGGDLLALDVRVALEARRWNTK